MQVRHSRFEISDLRFEGRTSQEAAHRREVEIKGWSRKRKIELIERFEAKQKAGKPFDPLTRASG